MTNRIQLGTQATATMAMDKFFRPVPPGHETAVQTMAGWRLTAACYVVRTHYYTYDGDFLGGEDHYGGWSDFNRAYSFAGSMGLGRPLAFYDVPCDTRCSVQVIEVPPYWYHCHYGRVQHEDLAAGDFELVAPVNSRL